LWCWVGLCPQKRTFWGMWGVFAMKVVNYQVRCTPYPSNQNADTGDQDIGRIFLAVLTNGAEMTPATTFFSMLPMWGKQMSHVMSSAVVTFLFLLGH